MLIVNDCNKTFVHFIYSLIQEKKKKKKKKKKKPTKIQPTKM